MIRCPGCGAMLDNSAQFCNNCGAPLFPPIQAVQQTLKQSAGQATGYYTSPEPAGEEMVCPTAYGSPPLNLLEHPTISETFRNCLACIGHRSVLLWGLSLLYLLICTLCVMLSVLPVFWIPSILLLSVGMTSIYLDAYRGIKIESAQLFVGFNNIPHFLGGLAWMFLWIFIWALIPIVGIVFALIKVYAYRFVPYILLTEPDISPNEALKKSVAQTDGYKGRMFCAELLMSACILGVYLLLFTLSFIPYMRIIFELLACLFSIFVILFAPLAYGTVQASFCDAIMRKSEVRAESIIENMA